MTHNTQNFPRTEDAIQGTSIFFRPARASCVGQFVNSLDGEPGGRNAHASYCVGYGLYLEGMEKREGVCVFLRGVHVFAVVMLRTITSPPVDRKAVMVMKTARRCSSKQGRAKLPWQMWQWREENGVAQLSSSFSGRLYLFDTTCAKGRCVSSRPLLRAPSRAPISPALREMGS